MRARLCNPSMLLLVPWLVLPSVIIIMILLVILAGLSPQPSLERLSLPVLRPASVFVNVPRSPFKFSIAIKNDAVALWALHGIVNSALSENFVSEILLSYFVIFIFLTMLSVICMISVKSAVGGWPVILPDTSMIIATSKYGQTKNQPTN